MKLNGVRFDGCDETRKVLLEAKGEGYAWAIEGDDFFPNYHGREGFIDDLKRQSAAADARTVEWHVAERPVALVLERMRLELGLMNIKVIHTPPSYRPMVVQ